LAALASTAHYGSTSLELRRVRRAALEAGRLTRAAQRDWLLAQRLGELGFTDLASYLRHACSAGASLRSIVKATGLGWVRLRRELDAAGLAEWPSCENIAVAR
jgi:hypothetical protein